MSDASRRACGSGWKLFAAGVVCAGLLALISFAQTLSPGEVRISSGPYPPPEAALQVQTNEVEVGVVVRDGKGKVVSGLKREDFAAYDDGREQAISSFSVETRELHVPASAAAPSTPAAAPPANPPTPARPRYVALYFDDLNTPFGDMRHVQLAAENFIHTGISPGDQIALFTASGSGNVDFTSNAQGILDAIEKLRFHGRTIESSGCPRITPYDASEIATEVLPPISDTPPQSPPAYQVAVAEAVKCNCIDATNIDADCGRQQQEVVQAESKQMWDSIREMSQDTLNSVQGVVNYLATKPGERVLVLSSSGFLTSTLEAGVDNLVDSALRAGVVINALDAKGLYTAVSTMDPNHGYTDDLADEAAAHDVESFGPAMSNTMSAMVDFVVGTGGRYFHNRNDLAAGYYSLAAAPETEYLLGFAPEKEKFDGKFHKLKVEVAGPSKFEVQARPGYFAPTKEASGKAAPQTAEEKIDAEVHGSEERSDFPLSVRAQPGTASKGVGQVRVQTHVDIENLPFDVQQDQHVDMLTFVTVLFDAQGKIVTGKEAQMRLALKAESFERFAKSGIGGGMLLEAPAGQYRLRVVVEEALHGQMSATSQSVQIQ